MTDDPLLPTPRASDGPDKTSHARTWSSTDFSLHSWVRERTSASSPGSEDSTSPSTPSDGDAPDRSSGTPPAPESSSDGGRMFPGGEMSPGSPLLPTPNTMDAMSVTRSKQQRSVDPRGGFSNLREHIADLTSSAEGSHVSPSAPPADARPVTTTAGSGRSSPVLLGSYDPERSSSRTSLVSYRLVMWTQPQASLFGDLPSERFSQTWPTSGMTRRGRAYALPMSARVIDASASSCLQTPSAADAMGGHLSRGGDRSDELLLKGQVKAMLPTPRREGFDAGNHRGQPDSLNQTVRQLPTPTTRDHKGRNQRDDASCLTGALLPTPRASENENRQTKRTPSQEAGTHGLSLAAEVTSLGDPTNQPSEDGNE